MQGVRGDLRAVLGRAAKGFGCGLEGSWGCGGFVYWGLRGVGGDVLEGVEAENQGVPATECYGEVRFVKQRVLVEVS